MQRNRPDEGIDSHKKEESTYFILHLVEGYKKPHFEKRRKNAIELFKLLTVLLLYIVHHVLIMIIGSMVHIAFVCCCDMFSLFRKVVGTCVGGTSLHVVFVCGEKKAIVVNTHGWHFTGIEYTA